MVKATFYKGTPRKKKVPLKKVPLRKLAEKNAKSISKLEERPELKVHQFFQVNEDVGTAGTVTHMTHIDHGLSTGDRVGKDITVKYLNMDYILENLVTADGESFNVRVAIVRALNDTIPTMDLLWISQDHSGITDFTQAFRNLDHMVDFKVIMQEDLIMGGEGTTRRSKIKVNKTLNSLVRWDIDEAVGNATNLQKGGLFLVVASSTDTTNTIKHFANVRIRYTDT